MVCVCVCVLGHCSRLGVDMPQLAAAEVSCMGAAHCCMGSGKSVHAAIAGTAICGTTQAEHYATGQRSTTMATDDTVVFLNKARTCHRASGQ